MKHVCIDLFRFYTRAISHNVWGGRGEAGIYYPSVSITQFPAMLCLISNAIRWAANSHHLLQKFFVIIKVSTRSNIQSSQKTFTFRRTALLWMAGAGGQYDLVTLGQV